MAPRVLVTDAQERSALATIRCLGAEGYEVTAVAGSRLAAGLWSGAAAHRALLPDPRHDVGTFVRGLESVLSGRRHEVLVCGTDASLFAVSRARERLEPLTRLGLPSEEGVERALDRERLQEAAAQVGLEAPESVLCGDFDAAARAAERYGYPVLAKPVRTVRDRDDAADRRASVLVRDRHELSLAASTFERCIVQRRLPGPVVSFGGVATDAGLLAFLVSRYDRTWPPRAGNACFSETIAAPPGLAECIEALVSRLGWTGLFEVELIEADSGRYAAIDFNPRPYGSMSLAVSAGVPLPALWCDWLLGEAGRPRIAPRAGFRYRWGEADLSNALSRLRSDPVGALGALRPHRGVTHPYFRMRDPAPAAARALELARKSWRATTSGGLDGAWHPRRAQLSKPTS